MTLENMIKCCKTLTPTENQLATYLLHHKDKIQKMSIQKLSEETFISKSAIHRFCKKVGLDGFNDLKVKLAQDELNKDNHKAVNVNFPFSAQDSHRMVASQLLDLYEVTIQETFNSIDENVLNDCVRILHQADIIDIYTYAHNLNIAENFQDKMRTMGRVVNCPKSFYEQSYTAASSNRNHVAIIMSYSGKATFIPPIVELLHRNQVMIISIGRIGNIVSKNYINHQLYICDREDFKNRISHFSSHIAMQYILDLLFSCIFKVDYQKNMRYIEEVLELIDERDLQED